jgi:hypothetical protein
MNTSDVQLTSAAVWRLTLVVAGVDILLVLLIRRFISNSQYGRLPRWITACSFLFYAALWSFVLVWAWDWFYSYVFPLWMRYSGLAWGLAYGAMGLGMWWLSLRFRRRLLGHSAANFCLLGGLEGLLTHLWAIFGAGAVSKPPIMHNVDPFTVLIFAIFEKAFYWILILLLAVGSSYMSESIRHQPHLA